ncbi:hypothetical protein IKF15_03785 [Candidatus Saccharibacteria bacterium]|nr:hypothetical protein [Candidatus Saccharibacteria bacterium]
MDAITTGATLTITRRTLDANTVRIYFYPPSRAYSSLDKIKEAAMHAHFRGECAAVDFQLYNAGIITVHQNPLAANQNLNAAVEMVTSALAEVVAD